MKQLIFLGVRIHCFLFLRVAILVCRSLATVSCIIFSLFVANSVRLRTGSRGAGKPGSRGDGVVTEGVPKVCRGMLTSQISSLKCIFNFALNGISTNYDVTWIAKTIRCLVLYITGYTFGAD